VKVAVGRLLAGGLCVALLSGCAPSGRRNQANTDSKRITGADGHSGSPGSTTCGGIGLPDQTGSVTYVESGRLISYDPSASGPSRRRCLLEGVGAGSALRWNGAGDKVILPDGRVDVGKGPSQLAPSPSSLSWSYPTGTAVLEVDGAGRLMRVPSGGGPPLDITFLGHHDDAVYHPAGTHIVSSGRGIDGTYGLWVATNRGQNVRLIARGETATSMSRLTFTANHQILFVADHGDHKDLHQLDLNTEKLVTVATIPAGQCFRAVVASRAPGGGVAWAAGACLAGTPLRTTAVRGGAFLPLDGTDMASAVPLGFLPDGTLVGQAARGLMELRSGRTTLLHAGSSPAAVRIVEAAATPIELPGIPGPESRAPA